MQTSVHCPWHLSGDLVFMVHIHPSGFCFSTVGIWIKTTQEVGAARWHGITTWISFLPLSNLPVLKVPENKKHIAYETGVNLQLQYDHQVATPTKNKIGGGSSMIVILYYYSENALQNQISASFQCLVFHNEKLKLISGVLEGCDQLAGDPTTRNFGYVYLMEHSGFTYTIWTTLSADCLSM